MTVCLGLCLFFYFYMPRNYVSRGLRGEWSEEQLKLAVSDVLNNSVSVKHSAEIHYETNYVTGRLLQARNFGIVKNKNSKYKYKKRR